MKFKDSSPEELRDIWENRKEFHLEVTEDILGFSNLGADYFTSPKEVPPTPIAFFKENFVQLIYHSSDDWKGRWMRFLLFVYASSGKIFYTKKSDDIYDAHVVWEKYK